MVTLFVRIREYNNFVLDKINSENQRTCMSGKGKLAAGLFGVILITFAGYKYIVRDLVSDCRVVIKRSFTAEEIDCVQICWSYAESVANSSGASCNLRGSWCSWWADGYTNCLIGAIG